MKTFATVAAALLLAASIFYWSYTRPHYQLVVRPGLPEMVVLDQRTGHVWSYSPILTESQERRRPWKDWSWKNFGSPEMAKKD